MAERNVGAIYLDSQSTAFEIKNAENQSLEDVQASGVYLTEQGGAGSVQQVDLVV